MVHGVAKRLDIIRHQILVKAHPLVDYLSLGAELDNPVCHSVCKLMVMCIHKNDTGKLGKSSVKRLNRLKIQVVCGFIKN